MTEYDDAAQNIVDELDALDRFDPNASGQKDATKTSMEIITRNVPHPSPNRPAYFATIEDATEVSADTATTLSWTNEVYIDPETFSSGPSLDETGVYVADFSVSFTGGTGTRSVSGLIQAGGSTAAGSTTIAGWDHDGGESLSVSILVSVTSAPITLSTVLTRIGDLTGTVSTVPGSASLLVWKKD